MEEEDPKAGFLMGLTAGYLALVEVLVRKGVIDKAEIVSELRDLIPQFSDEYETAKTWIEATISNIDRGDEDET